MALCGNATVVMWYDVDTNAIAEHDQWHTYEHMPERLAIPGFRRGSRWVNSGERPRYFVMYEVADVDVLSSKAYLDRLNNPTPWTTRIMTSLRGMTRAFCAVDATLGRGLAGTLVTMRFVPDSAKELSARLTQAPLREGLAGMHLLSSAAKPPMTREQRLRGVDNGADWALLINAYDADVAHAASAELGLAADTSTYRLDLTMVDEGQFGQPTRAKRR